MSGKFDSEAYADKWEKMIIPLMSFLVVISLVAAFALQFAVDSDCSQNRYVYCGETPAHQIKSHGDDHH